MASDDKSFTSEYREVLLERIDGRSKSFTTWFSATMVFSLAFLAFVLVPLVALQYDERYFDAQLANAELERQSMEGEQQRLNTQVAESRSRANEQEHLLEEKKSALTRNRAQVMDLEGRLAQAEQARQGNAEASSRLRDQFAALPVLREKLESAPDYDVRENVNKLRSAFANLGDRAPSPGEHSAQSDCPTDDTTEYVKCNIKIIVAQQIEEYSSLISTASEVYGEAIDQEFNQGVEEKIANINRALDTLISNDPQFWHSVRGKFAFFEELQAPMEALFDYVGVELKKQAQEFESRASALEVRLDTERKRLEEEAKEIARSYQEARVLSEQAERDSTDLEVKISEINGRVGRLNDDSRRMNTELTMLSNDLEKLAQSRSRVVVDRGKIESRIDSVQSPFGTLPIGLTEAVLAFPVLIAIGVAIYTIVLRRLIRLRRDYHAATIETYPESTHQINRAMNQIAPLWAISAGTGAWGKMTNLVLRVPELVWLAAVVLITYSWSLDPATSSATFLIRSGYSVLYALSFACFVGCTIAVSSEAKGYRNAVPAA